jgi:cell division protein FtsI (penicillin-binding protein 3)
VARASATRTGARRQARADAQLDPEAVHRIAARLRPAPPVRRAGTWPFRPGVANRRLVAVVIVTVVAFCAVIVRVGALQTVDADRLEAMGDRQRRSTVTVAANRGAITDRNGEPLAVSVEQYTVWADPRAVADPEGTAAALAPILGVEAASLLASLTRAGEFAYVRRQVDDVTAAAVRALDLPGINLLEEPKRFLPNGDLARNLVGRTDPDGRGIVGIELQDDARLTGTPGQLVRERDQKGNTIAVGDQRIEPAVPGRDLRLTIDSVLQYAAEQALGAQVLRTGAKGGMVIIADPRTGEILAMANVVAKPDVGGAVVSDRNNAVIDLFEPGSTNKVITVAAAIEEGVATPETMYTVPFRIKVSDHEFREPHERPDARWDLDEILTRSSNVGTIMVAKELGPERLERYLRLFGLGERTGLGFPSEAKGILATSDKWYGSSKGAIPIGQGVSVTALQMLQVFNIIANGGVAMPPRLVDATVDADGRVIPEQAPAGTRVVSRETAEQVAAMLANVVASEDGTGQAAAVPGYSVAGKTGTARKPQENGTYSSCPPDYCYHYVSSFAGFVPADDPRLSLIVVIDEPTTSIYAGDVAAPLFAELASAALSRLRIPPTGASSVATRTSEGAVGQEAPPEMPCRPVPAPAPVPWWRSPAGDGRSGRHARDGRAMGADWARPASSATGPSWCAASRSTRPPCSGGRCSVRSEATAWTLTTSSRRPSPRGPARSAWSGCSTSPPRRWSCRTPGPPWRTSLPPSGTTPRGISPWWA